MAYKFRGLDRRRLQSAVKAMDGILARDVIARGSARSSRISTRDEVIPAADSALGVKFADIRLHLKNQRDALRA